VSPHDHCLQLAAARGSSAHYALIVWPESQRRAMAVLQAFWREMEDIVDECSDAGVARRKLQWWREELHRMSSGTAQHPVAAALGEVVQAHRLPMANLERVADGVESALERTSYETFEQLSAYCRQVAGTVGSLESKIAGYADPRTPQCAEQLRFAWRLSDILRGVRREACRGRVYLPQDELRRFGVQDADLRRETTSQPLKQLFRFQVERIRRCYSEAVTRLPPVDRYRQRSGLILAAIDQANLDEIERDGFGLLERRIALTPLRKLWIAWRIERRERQRGLSNRYVPSP
jgi:phytoene synthase